MSDGREERKEQEERRKWEEERKNPRRETDDRERNWESDGRPERRDSRAVEEAIAHLDAAVGSESGRRTRRSFLVAAAAVAGGYGFYRWIDRSPGDQRIPRPLRKMLNFNAKVSRAVFDERALAPTYPVSRSMELRTNGNYGLKMDLVPESYRLQLVGVENAKRFPQYVGDVTAWEYKYAAKKEPGPVEHDTKVAPKDEAKVDPNSDAGAGEGPMMQGGPASTMVAGGGGKNSETKMPPAFEAAFAALKKAQGNKRPRGQEEAGESDNTLDPGTPGLLLTMDDVTSLPHQELGREFSVIEGWSEVVHWGGVRLRD